MDSGIKNIVVVSIWDGEAAFKKLINDLQRNIELEVQYSYIILHPNQKKKEALPQLKNAFFVSKHDFSIFGKLKNEKVRQILNLSHGVLIAAIEKENKLLFKLLKLSKLTSIGMEQEELPNFDLSFRKSQLKDGKLFKEINNYLTKIQL
ncbi:DUF6913 domain-containing protein [Brumimicrobium aurantiacum]|uniref:Uncharacterized protein n=1 Tax=Brumimicrobium aurantiacum TaxID=1737063 RepID=A0A3E1EUH9_9FLAO|nr:hypothetical protein [Brumimicrobium aurantiacum]RFC53214.1 hypothetical protein DXU93_14195 [Brumimicrobium aurantiacum]